MYASFDVQSFLREERKANKVYSRVHITTANNASNRPDESKRGNAVYVPPAKAVLREELK